MDRRLTLYILIGMVLGVIVGQTLFALVDPAVAQTAVRHFPQPDQDAGRTVSAGDNRRRHRPYGG
jgi:hypothetical protein